jgi:micrococcal nuclease
VKVVQRLALIVFGFVGLSLTVSKAYQPQATLGGPYRVVKVSDGDTIKLEGLGSVRLIGIDTPETYQSSKMDKDAQRLGISKDEIRRQGKIATAEAKRWLEGASVWLELDVTQRDRYGRILGYVYRETSTPGDWDFDGRKLWQVNLQLARAGVADVLTIPPNVRYADLYAQAVRNARENRLGLWR